MNKTKGNLTLDWLSFTYHRDDISLEDFEKLDDREKGKYLDDYLSFYDTFPELHALLDECAIKIEGYKLYNYGLRNSDSIRVQWDYGVASPKGVNISFPSHSLHRLYDCFKTESVKEILQILKDRNCQFSRIDLCYDDYLKVFKPMDFVEFDKQHRLISAFRTTSYMKSGVNKADTFYAGKRKSGRIVRVYDKATESDGEIDSVRYEFEFHGRYAKSLTESILSADALWFRDFMDASFRIVTADSKEKRMSNREIDPAWLEFLELEFSEEIPISFAPAHTPTTLKSKVKWLKNCLPVFSSIIQNLNIDYDEFFDLMMNQSLKNGLKDYVPHEEPTLADLRDLLFGGE